MIGITKGLSNMLRKSLTSTVSHEKRIVYRRTLFYECSPFSLAKHERSLIQKSVNAGCTTFFTRSGAHFPQLQELLADLQYDINDDYDTKNLFTLGHIISTPKNLSDLQTVQRMQSELQQVVTGMDKNQQHLQFLSLSFPPSFWQQPQHIEQALSDLLPPFKDFFAKSNTHFGLDLSTRLLTEVSAQQLSPIIRPLIQDKAIQLLTIATNAFTAQQASILQRQLSDIASHYQTFGTEVLRLHPSKPGQISPHYDYKHHHHYRFNNNSQSASTVANSTADSTTQSPAAASAEKVNVIEMVETKQINDGKVAFVAAESSDKSASALTAKEEEAILDLRAALDRAVTIEKVFLDKFAEKAKSMGVSVTDVCLGHVLAQVHTKMTYVEEYEYFLASQMDPKFEEAVIVLTKSDVDLRNFFALYRPIAHYVQASYRNLLQQRQLRLSQRFFSQQHTDNSEDNHYKIAVRAQQIIQAKDIGLSLVVVHPDEYNQYVEKKIDSNDNRSATKNKILEDFEHLRQLCEEYSHVSN